HLYATLPGHTLVLRYKDVPGVIAIIGQVLARAGINIDNITAPGDAASGDALAIVKTNKSVSEEEVRTIASAIGAKLAFAVDL
ncbi:MAG: ACT domain-containing protein, partial [Akkermansia sp.]